MDRRKFIQTGIAGVAGLSLVRTGLANIQMTVPSDISVDRVKLGKTGLKVSRIAMGTGTKGWNYQSNQTRLGLDNFVKIARHGYERGIRFFDMADMYGSQPFVGKALKELPREKLTLMTKMWTYDEGSEKRESVSKTLDRFRQEVGTDYFDILLLHCMTKGDWAETRKFYMDGLAKAKQDGIVKAVGVSCQVPTKVLPSWLTNLRVYLNAYNMFTWTSFDKYQQDPEIKSNSAGDAYMNQRVFNLGVQLTF